jgi:hypothetical protein
MSSSVDKPAEGFRASDLVLIAWSGPDGVVGKPAEGLRASDGQALEHVVRMRIVDKPAEGLRASDITSRTPIGHALSGRQVLRKGLELPTISTCFSARSRKGLELPTA